MQSQLKFKTLAVWAVAVFLAFGCAQAVFAQATDGNLVGSVVDATGAAVPKAAIVATNKDTGIKYSATSNVAGEFRINNLPVGLYDVDASASGMASTKTTNVSVELNRTASVNFNMTVAGTTTTIEVAEAPALLDTSSAQLQATFKSDLSLNLPAAGNYVNDTGVLNLSLLAAGVTQGGGVGYGTGPSVGGQRQTNNSFNVDGVDNNRHDVTGPTITVPNDSVAEFSILQNQFSPEFGGSSGGIFNTVVKYGTNELHGSLYEYFNNRDINAIDSLKAVQGFTSNPRFDYNRFGGTVGGPIKKNKLFYFVDWEYSPLGQASTPGAPIEAPTAAGYTTIAGLPGISKTNLGILQTYDPAAPVANAGTITVGGVKIPVGTVSTSGPSYVNKQNLVVAIDYNLGSKDQIRGRYVINRYHGIDTNAQLPVFYSTIPDNRSLASFSEFHNFSPTMLNELRVSYNRKNNNYPVGDQKFPGLDQFPNLTFDDLNLQVGPDSSTPQGYIQGSFQATDNITKTFGNHTLKAGYQFFDVIASNSFVQRARGDYDYSAVDLYLHDLSPDTLGERSVGVAGGIPAGYLFHGLFVNDDYRIKPNLTLNLGIRYEYVTVPVVSRYQQFSSAANYPGLLTFAAPQSQGTNWAPRVGFAYSPGKSGVWTVRGGFGINYDQTYNNLNINAKPAYFQQTEDVPNLSVQTPNFLANGGLPPSNAIVVTTDPKAARAAVSAYNYDQTRPYAINYTLGVQRSLGRDYVLEARYLGTKGVHLYVQDQINRITDVTPSYSLPTFFSAPGAAQLAGLNLTLQDIRNTLVKMTNFPSSPSNFYGQFGFPSTITAYHPVGNSKYSGLALQLNKRYSNNFSYMTAFTWSHALDDSTATVFSTVLTPRRGQDFGNKRNDWSSSSLDRRFRFTFTPTYDFKAFAQRNWMMKNVVGNWNIAATYTYQSPAYTTVQSGIDSNLNNDSAGDRSVVNPSGAANLSSGVTGIDKTGAPVTSATACTVGGASIKGANCTAAYVATTPGARYVQAGLGAFPNAGRNTFPMHPIDNIDLQLLKRFAITEKKRFEIGAQFSNLFNHPQWTGDLLSDVYPNQNNNTRSFLLTGNSAFGRFDQFFTSNPRTTSLVARFVF
jgi:hypothetical protein